MKDKEATQKLATDNIRFAYFIAGMFQESGIERQDLEGIALLGLVKAANGFDETKNVKFTTYASVVIKNEIRTACNKQKSWKNVLFLDDEIATLSNVEPGFEQIETKNLASHLLKCKKLRENERKAIDMVICQEMRQVDAGKRLRVSQNMISKYIQSGLRKIRAEI